MSETKNTYFVGLDIASGSFTACVLRTVNEVVLKPKTFSNDLAGFEEFTGWLRGHGIEAGQTVLCMEATGVYGEHLAYHLHAQGWWLAVQPPLEVKRAFHPVGHKNDAVDSRQIAEYALRYTDRLHRWEPREELLEQIRVLLHLREHYVRQRTAHKNALKALERKVVYTPLAEELHNESIQQLSKNIQRIEEELHRLFEQEQDLHHNLLLLMSIPGVGFLLAAHTLLIMSSLRNPYNPRSVAAYVGICPYEHQSGTSVYKPASSRHFGPATMRRLLRMAALSVRTHNPAFRDYYERKRAQGKPASLVLNNIANKLLRIMCAVVRDQRPFVQNHRSLHPAPGATHS